MFATWRLVFPVVLTMGFALPLIDRLVFFPERWMPPTPVGVEERTITAEDGVKIHGWYVAAKGGGPAPTVLWAHGNGGNIGGRFEIQAALAQQGLNVLAYDYRGYGKSEGSPSESGVYLDSRAAFDSLVASGVPASRIVCLGESLGGAVTIELATERNCAGVAVVATFTTIAEVARAHYGPLGALASGVFDSASRVGALKVPFLLAHGNRDDIVPYELGVALYEAAPEPKEFLRVEGASHNDIFLHRELLHAIAAFSKRSTTPPADGEVH